MMDFVKDNACETVMNDGIDPKKAKDEFVWNNFKRLFPAIASFATSWERSGSKMITIHMDDGLILWFLYYTPTNWNLGTKPWRMKPRIEDGNKGMKDGDVK